MIPVRLEVCGLTRFAEPVVVDFDAMPAGLVAVAGPNGAGKTSLLEAILLAIYGTLPTRPGSVYDYLCADKAHVVLDVTLDGDAWRFGREFNRKRRTASANVWINGEPATHDGKAGEVDTLVADRWPPLRQVLASAFAAQGGAGSFLSLKPADRKRLVVEMLGLDRLQELAKAAQVEAGDAKTLRDRAADKLAAAEAGAGRLAEARSALDAAVVVLNAAGTLRDAHQRAEREARGAVEVASNEADDARDAEADAQRKHDAAQKAAADAKKAWGLASSAYALAQKAAGKVDDVRALADTLPALEERQRHHDALTTLRDELASLGRHDVDALDADLAKAKDAKEAAEVVRSDAVRAASDLANLRDAAQEEVRLLGEVRNGERAASSLAAVPCGGRTLMVPPHTPLRDGPEYVDCSACPLIADAVAAKASLDDAREDLEYVGGASAELAEAAKRAERLSRDADLWASRGAEVGVIEGRLEHARSVVGRQDALRRQIEAIRAKAGAPIDPVALAAAQKAAAEWPELAAAAGARDARKEAEQAAKGAYIRAQADLAAADDTWSGAGVALGSAERAEREVRKPWLRARDALAQAERDLDKAKSAEAKARGAVEALQHAEQALEDAREAMRGADQAHEDAAMLAQALGRDGVQAMELDAVGPAVSDTATEIMRVVYGPRFTVQLVTQVLKKGAAGRKGETKEVFDVRAIDSARGTDGPAERLSGGEQVVVSESLKLALAIFAARSGGARLNTLIRDESDGALDSERALHYPAMLRRAQELGGFERVLLVSHRPDNVAACDAVLDVRDGQATLRMH